MKSDRFTRNLQSNTIALEINTSEASEQKIGTEWNKALSKGLLTNEQFYYVSKHPAFTTSIPPGYRNLLYGGGVPLPVETKVLWIAFWCVVLDEMSDTNDGGVLVTLVRLWFGIFGEWKDLTWLGT